MKSPYFFIVQPFNNKRYDNVREVDGKEFLIGTNIDDASMTQRVACVFSVPIGYDGPIKPGAMVIVHHNIFRLMYDIKGKEVSSNSYFFDDKFFVDYDRIYLYKNPGDSDWVANLDFCWVKPIGNDDDFSTKSNKELWGEVVYPSEKLISFGVNKGDVVMFQSESEYEFHIDGVLMYRMYDKNICLKK